MQIFNDLVMKLLQIEIELYMVEEKVVKKDVYYLLFVYVLLKCDFVMKLSSYTISFCLLQ